ncbi:hypothetical protein DM860_008670 [Cuscuta australis]|uniref:Protein kinase domain-containing protein n=1 Tax=Cuscuta australis TaxID=267555 RepID=A0A328D559_9ASTE|nr:hypothetical protein DM860_008670 [Cuscuta australis]
MRMNCFSCCLSGEEKIARNSLKKSIQEYKDIRVLASFANISLKSDRSRKKYIEEEIGKFGKGNSSAHAFTYQELSDATHNFNLESLLGEGGFGRAQPLFKDKNKFHLIADPLLEGNFPAKGLHQALAIAAMCLQEEADTRPFITDVVSALEFLCGSRGGEGEEEEDCEDAAVAAEPSPPDDNETKS